MGQNDSDDMPKTDHDHRTLELLELMKSASGESDRGLVITAAAHAEIYLERILRAFLIDDSGVDELFEGPFAPFGSLSGKIKVAYFLGLLTREERSQLDATRKVRNVFAHELNASFDHKDVKKLCAKPPIFDGDLCDRDAFLHMAMNVTVHIMYRDIGVARRLKRSPLAPSEREKLDRPS